MFSELLFELLRPMLLADEEGEGRAGARPEQNRYMQLTARIAPNDGRNVQVSSGDSVLHLRDSAGTKAHERRDVLLVMAC